MKNYFLIVIILIFAFVAPASIAATRTPTGNDKAATSGKPTPVIEEAVKLETPTGNLYGTLLLPQSKRKVPVVLMIAGSGPTDRNGNSAMFKGPNDSLKYLAEGLASQGIASLRYDKRGIGESGKEMLEIAKTTKKMPREEDFRFDALIDDAVLFGQKLQADKRFSSVTIVGHSEGSLIGMIAARILHADGYVSVAGAGRPSQQILLEQLKSQVTPELLKQSEEILNQLTIGQTVSPVPAALNVLFRPSVQPYMISWLRYNPTKEIAALRVPTLIVQGTTDIQISVEDAKLLAAAYSMAKLSIIEGMNHILKQVPKDAEQQIASYSNPALPVMPSLINEISHFVNKAKK